MNKTTRTLLCIAFSALPFLSIAQNTDASDKPVLFPKLFHLNKSVSVGIIGGVMDNFNFGAAGINASFYGLYADFMGWPRKHYDDLRIDKWEDSKVFAFHGGYQIPIHYYDGGSIKLIPLLGYARVEHGITDGSNWDVTDTGIVNSYHTTDVKSGLDYGAAFAYQNYDKKIGYYNFYMAYTRYTAWIGFGIEFSLRNLK